MLDINSVVVTVLTDMDISLYCIGTKLVVS